MILREYQRRAVDSLRAAYSSGKRAPVLVLPTAGGKTIVASEVIRLAVAKGTRVLFAVPRIELLDQAVSKLAAAGITNVRTIQAQNGTGPEDALVTVGSIPTLVTKRWMDAPVPADLVVVDECHHGKARTHEEFLKLYAHSKLLGLTATVQRGDGRGLGDLFDAIVVGATVKELTDLKALVPCKVFSPSRIMDSRELALDPVDAYQRYAPDSKCIVFCSTVEHAKETAESFSQRSIAARWVAGESRDRDEIIAAYSNREFSVLVSVNLFVEGFDDPPTEAAIMARRFTHVGSWLQAIGRTLRPSPSTGKRDSKIVDLCGSALVHGTPDLERTYSLQGKGISTQKQPIRQCQQCGAVFVSAAAQSCPYCEFKLPALTRAQKKAMGLALEEVDARTKKTSWPMRAKRHGTCSGCQKLIVPGTWIVYSATTRQGMHASCAGRVERKAA